MLFVFIFINHKPRLSTMIFFFKKEKLSFLSKSPQSETWFLTFYARNLKGLAKKIQKLTKIFKDSQILVTYFFPKLNLELKSYIFFPISNP